MRATVAGMARSCIARIETEDFPMIVVQDRIEVAGADLARLQNLFRERYMPAAEQRGLHFVESLVSPPLQLQDQPNTLWLRWSLPDAGAFWAARYASGDPAVVGFWSELDSFVLKRERHYLVPGADTLPGPEDTEPYQCRPGAWRETAQLYLKGDITDAGRAAFVALLERAATQLPGLATASLAANLVPDYGAGHYTWDLVYRDQATAQAARASGFWREQLLPALDRHCRARAALGLETVGAGARSPALANGVKRTALFRLLPGVSAALQSRFARDTLEMAAQIPAILNWRLSRAVPLAWDASDCAPWSFVWEQEYATLDGLTVDYMVHPHHWAHIDRWFDPESGAQIIDTALCHAFSPLTQSVIVR
jgi:hypothetical protein